MSKFLYIIGAFSSLVLISSGFSMNSIQTKASTELFGSQTIDEVFYNNLGTGFIGLGLFTGPTLFALANLLAIQSKKEQ